MTGVETENSDTSVTVLVEPDNTFLRIDSFLAAQCEDLSRSRLKALIQEGVVTVDGKICTDPAFKVKEGMSLHVTVPAPVDDTPMPEDIPLDVVYEDDALLVINKPVGLVVHPGVGHAQGTLVNALLYHCGDSLSGIGGVKRPGIVHRLDRETSGLMVVAKSDKAHHGLAAQLSDRSLNRIYNAFVWRVPEIRKGKVDQPIGRHPSNRLKMAVVRRNGREALTHYTLLETYGKAVSLMECKLASGRTHQIRVHMEYAGYPVLGDPLYGIQKTASQSLLRKSGCDEDTSASILSFPRQALHACQISFIHPLTGDRMTYESTFPADMQDLIGLLKGL